MLISTPATMPRTARRSAPQKPAKSGGAPMRALPRLEAADKAVFEAIANSPSLSLNGLQKLVTLNAQ